MITVFERLAAVRGDESGFTTAELLGNAALGVVALVAIWTLFRTEVAPSILKFIQDKLTSSG